MHTRPIINTVRAALAGQGALAGGDPALEAAVAQLTDAIEPALHLAAMQLAEQAAAEIDAQLSDRSVEVVLVDGDPSLRVTDAAFSRNGEATEELDARITLRLSPTLKQQIEQSAKNEGDSVNAWVIDALSRRSRRSRAPRNRITEGFDL
jgi:predicted HicB family RNase H-like nuclease